MERDGETHTETERDKMRNRNRVNEKQKQTTERQAYRHSQLRVVDVLFHIHTHNSHLIY